MNLIDWYNSHVVEVAMVSLMVFGAIGSIAVVGSL